MYWVRLTEIDLLATVDIKKLPNIQCTGSSYVVYWYELVSYIDTHEYDTKWNFLSSQYTFILINVTSLPEWKKIYIYKVCDTTNHSQICGLKGWGTSNGKSQSKKKLQVSIISLPPPIFTALKLHTDYSVCLCPFHNYWIKHDGSNSVILNRYPMLSLALKQDQCTVQTHANYISLPTLETLQFVTFITIT